MSNENLAENIAELLKPTIKDVTRREVGLSVHDLPDIVRKEMDACIDGKCDAIASKVIEKLPAIQKGEVPKIEGHSNEELAKTIKEIMANTKPTFTVEGHTAHDILDCPTCRPIVIDKLWQDEGYRQKIMENICEDDACRTAISKMFEEKGYGVTKNERTETWAERRLRERAERNK